MDGLSVLTNGSEVDKLKFLFKVYDVDGEPLAHTSLVQPISAILLFSWGGNWVWEGD